MPEGFEHRMAEVAHARIDSTGGIKFQVTQGHSSLAHVEQTPAGVAALRLSRFLCRIDCRGRDLLAGGGMPCHRHA